jgi:hypothetical protein
MNTVAQTNKSMCRYFLQKCMHIVAQNYIAPTVLVSASMCFYKKINALIPSGPLTGAQGEILLIQRQIHAHSSHIHADGAM